MPPVFVLVHSPVVGPATWEPVAAVLRGRGHEVSVPSLVDITRGGPPYWPRVMSAVREAVSAWDVSREVVLVAHSNAGLFVPALVTSLPYRVCAAVFADAALPAHAEQTPMIPPDRLEVLTGLADDAGLLPPWTEWFAPGEVSAMFPDECTRRLVSAEQPRMPLSYYRERVPVSLGWDAGRCGYLMFSPAYERLAADAAARGWPVRRLPGGHLHQLVDPDGVAEAVVELSR